MDTRLGGVALVTGAGSGIGRATALAFAARGARVVVAGRGDDVERTATSVREAGGEALALRVDVRVEAQVAGLVAAAVAAFGRVDYAVNNAGVGGRVAPITSATEAEFDEIVGTNLKGVWLCMKHELAQMRAQGAGAVVNVASVAGLSGVPGLGAYAASKHGVVGLTRAAALEVAADGVRVNAVCPGVILHTGISDPVARLRPERLDALVRAHPLGRAGEPEEVAAAIVWLCSPAAAFVTGAALPVDGGVLAGR